MENPKIEKIYYESFKNIDFINKYKKIMDTHNHSLEDILSRMDKSIIKKTFKEIGYDFKISSPGQFYVMFETVSNVSFKISFQISGGIIATYIHIYVGDNYIDIDNNKLGFLYRYLLNSMNLQINNPTFLDYFELKIILSDVLDIYEDFKKEFLKLMKEENLLIE